MCNLYSMTSNIQAIRDLVSEIKSWDDVGNMLPQPGIFPDYAAPIIRREGEHTVLTTARWGMPGSSFVLFKNAQKRAQSIEKKEDREVGKEEFDELLKNEPDKGVTNVRNTSSKHWKRWLGPQNRCLVPFNSFAEFNKSKGGNVWFAQNEQRPLAFFAGIWVGEWTSVRKVKEGQVTADFYAFLTTEPNKEVGEVHPKAMPVILTNENERETWLNAPWEEAQELQRPLEDGSLEVVAVGARRDPAAKS
ncbi:hypothetical protein MXMO3_03479 (plasmid) [Maritalea myrionectae]|uniref:Abasic site processing protein n=1 Tax=Maritalea myrionectae TaxID=454601 RepID=A0A2R4MJ10_9HYPH|nr:SOS response-associated peptidase family protein [Maritalea myrionectae]AVX05982.1 hypothetical protein MXMO3_03479 [Maritalea myrionectae]